MNKLNRRSFISQTALTGIGLSMIPSHVLGGIGATAANDKINVALIGVGTQAMKMLPGWLERDELQFVSVCDPNKESNDYPQWGGPQGETHGAAGGREVGRRFINEHYAKVANKSSYNGCTAYADFRELLADGRLWTASPPMPRFQDHPFLINDGRVYTHYFLGWPAQMLPDLWLGALERAVEVVVRELSLDGADVCGLEDVRHGVLVLECGELPPPGRLLALPHLHDDLDPDELAYLIGVVQKVGRAAMKAFS